jgi:ABC-type transport system substrate-binding protein
MPATTKTLRVGLLAPVHDLDPRGGRDFVGGTILEQVFETPFDPAPDPDHPARPRLFAEGLRSEDGGRTLSAPLREGVRFSDGTPLTPELLAEILSGSTRLSHQARVEARDERVVFRLPQPTPRFDRVLTHRYSEVALVKDGEVLGTGPYRVAADSRPERVHLVPNPERDRAPEIEEVLFEAYPPDDDGSPSALVRALEAGEVDFTNVLSREHIAGLKGFRKWLEPGIGTGSLYFNLERPGLADVQVRRALALAIDRVEVARISYHNPMSFTATGLLPPMLGSWRDGIVHDPKRAAALLKAVGDARPERLSMFVIYGPRPYLPQPMAVAEHLAERLGTLGIQVEVRQAENMTHFFRELARGDYDLALSGWVADTTEPADFLYALLSPDAIPAGGKRIVIDGNLARWKNESVGEAIERCRLDPSPRNLAAVLQPVTDEMPLLPLMYGPTVYVYSPRVTGFRPSLLGIPRFAELSLSNGP